MNISAYELTAYYPIEDEVMILKAHHEKVQKLQNSCTHSTLDFSLL